MNLLFSQESLGDRKFKRLKKALPRNGAAKARSHKASNPLGTLIFPILRPGFMTAMITVHGGLTDVPNLQFTQSGTPCATGTVASTERYMDRKSNEWRDGKKLYARYTAWGPLAENIAASGLEKGAQVTVTGKLHTREFEDKQGNKRSSTELELTDFAVSLKHATAQVTRSQRVGGASGAGSTLGMSDPWGTPQNGFDGFGDEPSF